MSPFDTCPYFPPEDLIPKNNSPFPQGQIKNLIKPCQAKKVSQPRNDLITSSSPLISLEFGLVNASWLIGKTFEGNPFFCKYKQIEAPQALQLIKSSFLNQKVK